MPRTRTNLPLSPEASAQREPEKSRLIEVRWNHPSIIAWCPFNEGWDQHDTLRYATWIKELDLSRLVDEASGDAECPRTMSRHRHQSARCVGDSQRRTLNDPKAVRG